MPRIKASDCIYEQQRLRSASNQSQTLLSLYKVLRKDSKSEDAQGHVFMACAKTQKESSHMPLRHG